MYSRRHRSESVRRSGPSGPEQPQADRHERKNEMRPRMAAKMLTLAGLLMMSCGDGEGPASPTPTPTPTPTRQLQRVTWECDREETTVGVDLHCHATGRYNTEPQEASLTSSLTDSMVHTSDASVLSPGGYRADLDGQPFVIEATGAGQGEVWVTFDGHTSNRWRVTVNAVRELMGVDWTCDRREAEPGRGHLLPGDRPLQRGPQTGPDHGPTEPRHRADDRCERVAAARIPSRLGRSAFRGRCRRSWRGCDVDRVRG